MTELLCKQEVYAVIGAAMEVHNMLGRGFLEPVYQEALDIELAERGIPFTPQPELRIFHKNRRLEKMYKPDLLVFDQIIVELKALDRLSSCEQAQLLNYLKATGFPVGILINFGANMLEWKRMARTIHKPTRVERTGDLDVNRPLAGQV
jgi:GxxExxY protein